MSPCLYFSMFPGRHFYVSMFPCLDLHVSMSRSTCLHVSTMTPYPCLHVSEITQTKTGNTVLENSNFYFFATNGKGQAANFRLFAANGNGKRKFVFLGRQTINDYRRSLFQQTCTSMVPRIDQSSR
jgi:hypothetical protein